MSAKATNRRIRDLLTDIEEGALIVQPAFQRNQVWKLHDKYDFIETVLDDHPFPEIYVAREAGNEDVELLVDGQQRITTLFEYFKNSPALGTQYKVTRFSKLTNREQRRFLNYEVVVRDLGILPMLEIEQTFRRINKTGYSLNKIELANSEYSGKFMSFGKDLAKHPFFEKHNLFTSAKRRRMTDVQYCLNLIATMMCGYTQGYSINNHYMSIYNDQFEFRSHIESRIKSVFDFIEKCKFPDKSKIWSLSNFFTLFIELDKKFCAGSIPSVREVSRRLKSFYSNFEGEVDIDGMDTDAADYFKNSIQGVNHLKARTQRADTISRLIA